MLIPLNCEYFALEGLADLVATLRRVRASLNPSLDIAGVLMTMYDERTNLGQQVSRDIREFFTDRVFDTVIPRNIRLGEAPSHGLPAILYDVKSRGSEAYLSLARELLAREAAAPAVNREAKAPRSTGHGVTHGGKASRPRPWSQRADSRYAGARRRGRPLARRGHRSAAAEQVSAAHADGRRADRGSRALDPLERHHPADRRPRVEQGFEIIAGERRWRAAQRAGLLKVPVVVRDIPEDRLLAVALIENIQRENLNPIEEAVAYRRLSDEFHLTQEQIADAVGKDRSSIANYVRLLRLPQEVRASVSSNALSMGHARALLALTDEAAQLRVARDVVSRNLSVRETEALVKKAATPDAPKPEKTVDVHTRAAEEKLRLALGTRVRINRKGKSGRIEIEFVSEDELQRIYERLTSEGVARVPDTRSPTRDRRYSYES